MDETDKQLGAKLATSDVKRGREIEAMMNTEGWKQLSLLLNTRINELASGFFGPTPDGGSLAAEHKKGVIFGLIMARDWPTAIVQAAKEARTASAEETR